MGDRILGLGCDIVEVARIERLLAKNTDSFAKRILTPQEETVFNKRYVESPLRGVLFVCTRFAAKEAFSKAMGTGIGHVFSFQDLGVLNDENGRPRLDYSEKLEEWMAQRRAFAMVSLSDERAYAMASVILYTTEQS